MLRLHRLQAHNAETGAPSRPPCAMSAAYRANCAGTATCKSCALSSVPEPPSLATELDAPETPRRALPPRPAADGVPRMPSICESLRNPAPGPLMERGRPVDQPMPSALPRPARPHAQASVPQMASLVEAVQRED